MQPENIIIPGMGIHSLQLIKQVILAKLSSQNRLNLTVLDYFNIKSPTNYLIIPVCRLTLGELSISFNP